MNRTQEFLIDLCSTAHIVREDSEEVVLELTVKRPTFETLAVLGAGQEDDEADAVEADDEEPDIVDA